MPTSVHDDTKLIRYSICHTKPLRQDVHPGVCICQSRSSPFCSVRRSCSTSLENKTMDNITMWNSLPPTVRDPSLTLTAALCAVKTVLFCRVYETLPQRLLAVEVVRTAVLTVVGYKLTYILSIYLSIYLYLYQATRPELIVARPIHIKRVHTTLYKITTQTDEKREKRSRYCSETSAAIIHTYFFSNFPQILLTYLQFSAVTTNQVSAVPVVDWGG